MTSHTWQTVLTGALLLNAGLITSYRLYRMKRGGPKADAVGGAVLGAILAALAILVSQGVEWARWPALLYAAIFAFVVMPIWTLAVLIPLRPGAPDLAFTGVYWTSLFAIGLAALLV